MKTDVTQYIIKALATTVLILLVGCATKPDLCLRKLDPRNGMTKWSVSLPEGEYPVRCEAYPGRIVVYLYRNDLGNKKQHKGPQSHVLFFDSETGKPALPFDTRDFVYPWEDPLMARSDGNGPILDYRNELQLSNGWTSLGVGWLPWRNTGTNTVILWQGWLEPKWAITLPEGAYNLSNWRDLLVFKQSIASNGQYIDILFGQNAGAESPAWEFKLPNDVPAIEFRSNDAAGLRKLRTFRHFIGQKEVFVFGNGLLFALEPTTGKPLWRCMVAEDPTLKKHPIRADDFLLIDFGDDLLLFNNHMLARFSKASQNVTTVLRGDVRQDPPPFLCERFVYCFTD